MATLTGRCDELPLRQLFPVLSQPARILCRTFHGGASENMPSGLLRASMSHFYLQTRPSGNGHVFIVLDCEHIGEGWGRGERAQDVSRTPPASATLDARSRTLAGAAETEGRTLISPHGAKGAKPERPGGSGSLL